MGKVPARCAVAFTDGFDCPHCQARLEVAGGSRAVAIVAGLAAAWLVWRFTSGAGGVPGMVLPELYALLAFGAVSALVLMRIADLRAAQIAPAVEAVSGAGHASSGPH
jgi:hypothetical protein